MHTVLIAHSDRAFAKHLGAVLRYDGYRVIASSERLVPGEPCTRCDTSHCPVAAGADLMICDPEIAVVDARGESGTVATDVALAHPEIPILLAWSPQSVPDLGTLRAIRVQAPHTRVAATGKAALIQQLHTLLAATQAV